MEIEFDPAKDERNIAKHGMSLQAAEGFDWDTAFEREDDRFDYGEVRFVAIGLIGNRLHVLAFTEGSHNDGRLYEGHVNALSLFDWYAAPDQLEWMTDVLDQAVRAISLRPAEKHEARFIMAEFDPEIHDDNPPMDAAFMAGMKPSRQGGPSWKHPRWR